MKTIHARAQPANVPPSNHHVALIPGFLGFNKLADFSYFADTVGTAIADSLARRFPERRVPVHAFETVPAGSLQERKDMLIKQLKTVRAQYPYSQLHLVGHSTGGLDAELLLRTAAPAAPYDAETEEIRRAIRSVTTIAAPLAGTSLALSPLARFFAIDSLRDVFAAPLDLLLFHGPSALLGGIARVLALFLDDESARELSEALLHSGAPGVSYLLSLVLKRALIAELAPDKLQRILAQTREDSSLPPIRRARFVTIARRQPQPSEAGAAGLLFRFLYDNTAREAHADPEVLVAAQTLQKLAATPGFPIIGVPPLPTIDMQANDGIVDTLRQILPSTAATIAAETRHIAALVIADHLDVVGYFPLADGRNNGFLSSGSAFREPQLQQLYAAVANEIAHALDEVGTRDGQPRPQRTEAS